MTAERPAGSLGRFVRESCTLWLLMFALPFSGVVVILASSPGAAWFVLFFMSLVLSPSIPTAFLIWRMPWPRTSATIAGGLVGAVAGGLVGAAMQVAAFAVMWALAVALHKVTPPLGPQGPTPLDQALFSSLIVGWWAPLPAFIAGAVTGFHRDRLLAS